MIRLKSILIAIVMVIGFIDSIYAAINVDYVGPSSGELYHFSIIIFHLRLL